MVDAGIYNLGDSTGWGLGLRAKRGHDVGFGCDLPMPVHFQGCFLNMLLLIVSATFGKDTVRVQGLGPDFWAHRAWGIGVRVANVSLRAHTLKALEPERYCSRYEKCCGPKVLFILGIIVG